MAFIKDESEDFRIEEVFSLKQDTEEQTGQFSFSKLNSLVWSLFKCPALQEWESPPPHPRDFSLNLNFRSGVEKLINSSNIWLLHMGGI